MTLRTLRRTSFGFTLVEVMLVVATIALLATIAMPSIFRSRKRSQATRILDDLRMIDAAMSMYAMEYKCDGTEPFTAADSSKLKKYLKEGSPLQSTLPNDFLGNSFSFATLDTPPKVSQTTYDNFTDVAPSDFWSPFNP